MSISTDCDFQLVITEVDNELVIEQPEVAFLEVEATGLPGAPGKDSPALIPIPFGRVGPQYVQNGEQEFTIEYDATALGVRAKLVGAPVGDDFVIALCKNGTRILYVTIPDGQKNSGYVLVPTIDADFAAGDVVTFDWVQVGSTQPGTTLTLTLWMKVTD